MWIQFRPDSDVWAFGVEPAKVRYRLRLARYPALAEYLGKWLRARPAGQRWRLLDIGAGFGRTFLYLQGAGIADRFDLRGLDIDPQRKGDLYAQSPWDIRQGDAQDDLPYAEHSLDVVVCEQLLEHLEHPDRVIRNVRRVLRPDGLFVVGVPIFPESFAKLRRAMVRRYGLRGSDHVQTYSLRSIRRDLAVHFDVIEQRGFRIVSGGLLRKLENYHWWYRFNRRLGALLPGLCIEVQIMARPKPR